MSIKRIDSVIRSILKYTLFNHSIQGKLFISSVILTLIIILAVDFTSQNLMTGLLLREHVKFNINAFSQASKYFNTVFEHADMYMQKAYMNEIINKNLNDAYDRQDFRKINEMIKTLDNELGNIFFNGDYIEYAILIGSNDFAYTYQPRNTGRFLGDDFDYQHFTGLLNGSDSVKVGVPFYFNSLKNTGLSGYSENELNKILDGKFLLVRELKNSDNHVSGTIIIIYENKFISDTFSFAGINQSLYLFDNLKTLIWTNGKGNMSLPLSDFQMNTEESTNFVTKNINGTNQLFTYAPMVPYNFMLASLTPVAQILSENQNTHSQILIYLFIFLVVVFYISFILAKKISRPIKHFSQKLSSKYIDLKDYLINDDKVFMPNFTFQRKIVVFFIFTVVVPCLVFISAVFSSNYIIYKKTITNLTIQTIRQVKWNIDYRFESYEQITSELIYNSEFQDAVKVLSSSVTASNKTSIIENMISKIKASNKELISVSIYDSKGTNLCSSNYFDTYPVTRVSSEFYNEMQTDKGRLVMLGIQKDTNMDQLLVFSRKIRNLSTNNMGKILGYVIFSLDQEMLDSFVRRIKLGDSGYFFITDSKGTILLHDDYELTSSIFKSENGSNKLPASRQGSISIIHNKNNYHVFYDTSAFFDMKIVGIIPDKEINSRVYPLILYCAAFLILCIMIILIASAFISLSITKPLKKLGSLMGKISEGNLNVHMDYKGKDEIAILSKYFNHMIQQLNELIQANYQSKIRESELLFLEKEAQLNALQQQINPHFLYNTLESIKWMAYTIGADAICDMATALGKFFRGSITKGKDYVTFKDEVDHLKNYIYIQQLRYQNKFNIVWKIDDEVNQYKIIKLVLQPIVENALTHGIDSMETGGLIIISSYTHDQMLHVEIQDNGIGMPEEHLHELKKYYTSSEDDSIRTSIGIKNVYRRLKLYYQGQFYFDMTSSPGAGTMVKFGIPIVK